MAKLTDYPYFSGRKVLLSVGLRGPDAFEGNVTEAQVRDLCLAEAKIGLAEFSGNAEWFDVRKEGTETNIRKVDGNFSLPKDLDFSDLADRSVMLKLGRTNDGGYAVIIGGIINAEGKMESHGRWLPYPILVPMMVGTAMSIEKDYYSADTAFEIGRLSQKALGWRSFIEGRIRSFLLVCPSISTENESHSNGRTDPELSQTYREFLIWPPLYVCSTALFLLQLVKLKKKTRKSGLLPMDEREEAREQLLKMIEEKKVVQSQFDYNLQIIYSATLLSGNPSGILRFITNYPVYEKMVMKTRLSVLWTISNLP